ncbi:MAG: hypothetical protein GY832_12270 [Chloroflexi bacterium]|nr:hypothetical protein [Chloroflexota bacterium]
MTSSQWLRYPKAEAFVKDHLEQFAADMPPVQALQAAMLALADNRLVDWLDHLVLADGDAVRGQLANLGFEPEDVPAEPEDTVFVHPSALFPWLVLRAETKAVPGTTVAAAISVEDINAFLMAQRVAMPVMGTSLSPYRRAKMWQSNGREFFAVERRGHRGFVPLEMEPGYPQRYLRAYEQWITRPRQFKDARAGMEQTLFLAQSLVDELGTDTAAWVFLQAEQACWQQRNWAGQVQKNRQDHLGLGLANRDHAAFRSSREVFALLIQILETFGFRPRERFYAGAEAGWGAQVMEQSACRFAIFADVDLAPDEVEGDFAHRPLAPQDHLGSIGLWCALHDEAMLAAGPHHFACRLAFDAAIESLDELGIKTMHPFSEFAYLQQAFTWGERWSVPPERLERLVAANLIDAEQSKCFVEQQAVGSHMENIQRGEGFKGFNQQTVSDIIRRTDPRES